MTTFRPDTAFLFDVDNTLLMSASTAIVAINARLLRLKKGHAAEEPEQSVSSSAK